MAKKSKATAARKPHAPRASKVAKEEGAKKVKGVSSLKIQLAYERDGVDAVMAALDDGTYSLNAVRKASKALAELDRGVDLVEALDAAHPAGERGRTRLVVGDSRKYKIQQIGEAGEPFIRLPLSTLGAKGESVIVTIEDGLVSVTKAIA